MNLVNQWYKTVPTILTERLILRPLAISDVEALHDVMSDPDMYQFIGRKMSVIEQHPEYLFERRWYRPKRQKMLRWGITMQSDDMVIGEIMLYNIQGEKRCKIGCRIRKESWGLGIAKEATKALVEYLVKQGVFEVILADVMVGNIASYCSLAYSGFIIRDYIPQGRFGNMISDYYIYQYVPQHEEEEEE